MKEVDLETRTTKAFSGIVLSLVVCRLPALEEGRVETLVICAIEKDGRIVKDGLRLHDGCVRL